MTLRARLTLSAALAVAAAVVLASIAVYFVVRSEMLSEVDNSLRQRAALIQRGPLDARFPDVPEPFLGGPGGYVQLVRADGVTLRQPGGRLGLPVDDRTLEVYVGYLRRKTEAGGEPRLIHTVRGVGYALREQ